MEKKGKTGGISWFLIPKANSLSGSKFNVS